MKSITLSIACLALSLSMNAEYTRTEKNGGPHGYHNTSKVENGGDTAIECSDPGWNNCPTSYAGSGDSDIPVKVQSIASDFALNQINEGNLKGNQRFNISGSGIFDVAWSSTIEPYSSIIRIKVAQ